jgi:hypothetical protein
MRPITPQPGFTESDLTDLLASRQFIYADCYTIIPKTGDPQRYTSAQRDVSVIPLDDAQRRTYAAGKVLIDGLLIKTSVGVEVDEQEITLDYSDQPDYQNHMTWAQALLRGRLDGAHLRRDRFFASSWGSPWVAGVPMFLGLVSSLTAVGRQSATVSVKSDLVLLDVQMPRDLFEPNCKNTWGDDACGLDQSDFATAGTIGASPTRSIIPWSGSSTDFTLGKIHISSGDSVTRVRTISRADASYLYLSYPLDFDPVEGNNFTAYPNCRRLKDNCITYHGDPDWRTRFKGFPFVPVAETAIG